MPVRKTPKMSDAKMAKEIKKAFKAHPAYAKDYEPIYVYNCKKAGEIVIDDCSQWRIARRVRECESEQWLLIHASREGIQSVQIFPYPEDLVREVVLIFCS